MTEARYTYEIESALPSQYGPEEWFSPEVIARVRQFNPIGIVLPRNAPEGLAEKYRRAFPGIPIITETPNP